MIMSKRRWLIVAAILLGLSSVASATVAASASVQASPRSNHPSLCRYFPAARGWAYSSSTHDRWKKLLTTAPNQFDADILNLWIEEHGEHKDPGYRFRRVHRECNPRQRTTLTAAVTPLASAPKLPNARAVHICGGEGEVLCISNPSVTTAHMTKIVRGTTVKLCYYSDTNCRLGDHIWERAVGRVGYNGYHPIKNPVVAADFHGAVAYRLYLMTWSKSMRKFEQASTWCLWPHPGQTQHGAHVIIEQCTRKNDVRNFGEWILKKDPYDVFGGAWNIFSIHEINADVGNAATWVMGSAMRIHDNIHIVPFSPGGNTSAGFHQAFFFSAASLEH